MEKLDHEITHQSMHLSAATRVFHHKPHQRLMELFTYHLQCIFWVKESWLYSRLKLTGKQVCRFPLNTISTRKEVKYVTILFVVAQSAVLCSALTLLSVPSSFPHYAIGSLGVLPPWDTGSRCQERATKQADDISGRATTHMLWDVQKNAYWLKSRNCPLQHTPRCNWRYNSEGWHIASHAQLQ